MTDEPTEQGSQGRPSPLTALVSVVAMVCLAVAAALVRWSLWWPHGDMRQIWASGITVVAGMIGAGSLLLALMRLRGTRRWSLIGSAVAAVAIGLVVGFEVLETMTVDLR